MIQVDQPVLEGKAALDLWLAGKDAWNEYFYKNSYADISFEGVDFSVYRGDDSHAISFEGFRFPRGTINFSGADFGDGDVSFNNALFTGGKVLFVKAIFRGNGNATFESVTFDVEIVSFQQSVFFSNNVQFSNSNFFSAKVDFYLCVFSAFEVSYYLSKFGGDVDFRGADFGEGLTDFHGVEFKGRSICFTGASFGAGDTIFNEVNFGDGEIYFNGARFNHTKVNFYNSKFGNGLIRFIDVNCKKTSFIFVHIQCHARFLMKGMSDLDILSFRDATFDNVLSISDVQVNNIVDLVNTKLTNQFSLHGLDCSLRRENYLFVLNKAVDQDDIERAIRLKDLAETNKHHSLALKFHAIEMQAKRWQRQSSITSSILDLCFEKLCNYGQSVLQPFSFWLLLTTVFAVIYINFFRCPMTTLQQAGHGFVFSMANSLPFLNTANEGRNKALDILFKKEDVASYILPLMMTQGVLSVLLLFLVGLGLRNRFRI